MRNTFCGFKEVFRIADQILPFDYSSGFFKKIFRQGIDPFDPREPVEILFRADSCSDADRGHHDASDR
jgi:hypothetical protein